MVEIQMGIELFTIKAVRGVGMFETLNASATFVT
jgi:hypothetical protein